ncbi:MAG: type II toxin-antitoxin system VapC family toxin [Candidatus Diapherotrites archaeon]|nr:type II toxin-antitoxin system VapC family toxin [Candidatus Diapherotrites archaeon]
MYCLDTNIIIAWLKGDSKIIQKISTLTKAEIGITAITLCELYKGAYLHAQASEKVLQINELADNIFLMEFGKNACQLFGKDFLHLQKKGKMTQAMDLIIASIAKAHNATLVTRNLKDFENISELKIEVW